MSKYNGSDGVDPGQSLSAPGGIEALLALLAGGRRERTEEESRPTWVGPKKEVNPVTLTPLDDSWFAERTPEEDDQTYHRRTRRTIQWISRHLHAEVLKGVHKGVSMSDLYWAWQDSNMTEIGDLGDFMASLVETGLVSYDPTLKVDQQIYAIGRVVPTGYGACWGL